MWRRTLADIVDAIGSHGVVDEWRGEDFENEGRTARLVADDVGENLIVEEERSQDGISCLRFVPLVNDLEHCQVSHLVSAKMNKVRDKSRREDRPPLREGTCVQEPSQQESTI